ncbi:MAG: aldose epimerase family protein [Planctomycetota bacterium]
MTLTSVPFGTTPDGESVLKTTLTNTHGHHVDVMNWGASLLEVHVPDRTGELANVNAVFDALDPYLRAHPGFGSSIGRFCNRIGLGRFVIDGIEYPLTINHGKHCLHGGTPNWSHAHWQTLAQDQMSITYGVVSPDGDQGFPGAVTAKATYQWNDNNELTITYEAETDAPTHVNLTNHSYWNLGGIGSGSIRDHVALIHGDQTLTVDDDLIPTGDYESVSGSPFDFLHPTTIGQRIDALPSTKGYDHCYVIAGPAGTLRPAALVLDPASGRTLEIETTQPGMQLYTGNHLGGNEASAGLRGHEAFCLETQHYPDSPHHEGFPSTLLRPGQVMREVTVHRFGVSDDNE